MMQAFWRHARCRTAQVNERSSIRCASMCLSRIRESELLLPVHALVECSVLQDVEHVLDSGCSRSPRPTSGNRLRRKMEKSQNREPALLKQKAECFPDIHCFRCACRSIHASCGEKWFGGFARRPSFLRFSCNLLSSFPAHCGLRLLETGPTAALLWGWDFRRVV